jgi:HSP20 family protein
MTFMRAGCNRQFPSFRLLKAIGPPAASSNANRPCLTHVKAQARGPSDFFNPKLHPRCAVMATSRKVRMTFHPITLQQPERVMMAQEIKKGEAPSSPATRPSDPYSVLRSEMDRVFDTFLPRGLGGFPYLSRTGWERVAPSIDLRETDKEFVVEAELPGIDEKDVHVTLNNGVLTLKGEKKSEHEETKSNYHLMERSYGSFQRSFELGDSIEPDKVSANFENGVLKVILPKRAEAAQPEKRIPIGKG